MCIRDSDYSWQTLCGTNALVVMDRVEFGDHQDVQPEHCPVLTPDEGGLFDAATEIQDLAEFSAPRACPNIRAGVCSGVRVVTAGRGILPTPGRRATPRTLTAQSPPPAPAPKVALILVGGLVLLYAVPAY